MPKWIVAFLYFGVLTLTKVSDASAQNRFYDLENGPTAICQLSVARGYYPSVEYCLDHFRDGIGDDTRALLNALWSTLHLSEVLGVSEQAICTRISQARPPASWIAAGFCYYIASRAPDGSKDAYGAVMELNKYFDMADPAVVSQLNDALARTSEESRALFRQAILLDLRRFVPQMQNPAGPGSGVTINEILRGWVTVLRAYVTVTEQVKLPKPNNTYEVWLTAYVDGEDTHVGPFDMVCNVDDMDNLLSCYVYE